LNGSGKHLAQEEEEVQMAPEEVPIQGPAWNPLADAFGRTQNIEESWAAGPKRQRSSSVGDVFFVEDEGYYKDRWVVVKEAQSEKPLTVRFEVASERAKTFD
jgi:hypothetical protein